MEPKSALQSKTIGLNALYALGLLLPGCEQWLSLHPRLMILSMVVGNIFLRFISHGKLELTVPDKIKSNFSYLFPMILLIFTLGAANCTTFPIDRAISAQGGNDYVAVLSGYGQASRKGYLFLQANERASVAQPITMTFPKVDCKRESCVRFQFFRKDGSAGYAGAVAKGQASVSFPLSAILGKETALDSTDEGEYSVISQVYFLAPDGQEYSMIGNGFVRVNVVSVNYRPLACNDPSVAWKSPAGPNCEAQYSTGFRTAVCGKGCE